MLVVGVAEGEEGEVAHDGKVYGVVPLPIRMNGRQIIIKLLRK